MVQDISEEKPTVLKHVADAMDALRELGLTDLTDYQRKLLDEAKTSLYGTLRTRE